MVNKNKLSNLQLELLKLYSENISNSDLINIRKILADYFLDKAESEISDFVKEHNITGETYQQWANEHNRVG